MPESSVQEAVLRLARQLKLIPTAPPGNPGPAYHPGPEWPVQSLSDAATVPAQFFGELLRGLMDPLGANNQAPVENIGALLGAAMPLAGGLRGLRAGQLAEEAATAGKTIGTLESGMSDSRLFHGTRNAFSDFKASKGGEFGPGVYLTKNPDTAHFYAEHVARGPNGPTIMPVTAELKNPFRVSKTDWIKMTERSTPSTVQKRLMAKGHDGIVGVGINGVDEQIVVFDPANVRSVFADK